jgi:D-3-phosphoglycerate dehydrogenase / 2-oxoglutarate reductase
LPFSPEFDPLNGISCRASADSLDQIRERTEFMRAVFVDCTEELAKVIKARGLQIPDSLEIYSGALSRMELIGCCQGADVLLVEHTMLPPEVFDVCPSVRSVIFLGTGAGSYIDLPEAARRGISVVTTPGYGNRAVAEHALALIFAGARDVARMDREIRLGSWRPRGGLQLRGRRLAIVGLGGIGAELAAMASGLGMRVRGWNRTRKDHPSYVSDLDEAMRDADVVSLHLALNDETFRVLDGRRLGLLGRGSIVVNTARGALIDDFSLLEALDEGQVGHAALDVFPDEPLPADNPYVGRNNVTLTAHAAYMTDDAYAELWSRATSALNALTQP